jgi:hypothetical protein
MLPGVIGKDANDARSHGRRGDTKGAHERLYFIDFADDFGLFPLFVGFGFVEEELILFIAGQLSAIGKQRQEAGCNDRPDNEHDGYKAHSRFLRPVAGSYVVGGLRYLTDPSAESGIACRPMASYACA